MQSPVLFLGRQHEAYTHARTQVRRHASKHEEYDVIATAFSVKLRRRRMFCGSLLFLRLLSLLFFVSINHISLYGVPCFLVLPMRSLRLLLLLSTRRARAPRTMFPQKSYLNHMCCAA